MSDATSMTFRPLGRSGPRVSTVGLGCNNFRTRLDDDASRAVIDAAIDQGITLFDTADVYGGGGGEEVLGAVLGTRRDRVVLATKAGLPMPGEPADEPRGSRGYLHRAVRASLRRLRTDWIDLYQLHAPDPLTPIEETMAAFDELIQQGLIRYAGSSTFAAWQLVEADWTARVAGTNRFVSAQYHYHLLHRAPEADVVPVCERYGVGTLPFFPLANGLLTGKYRKGEALPADSRLGRDPARAAGLLVGDAMDRVEALRNVAEEAGISMIELAIGWLLAQPTVASVIAGASTPTQVAANVAVASRPALSSAVLEAVDRAAPR